MLYDFTYIVVGDNLCKTTIYAVTRWPLHPWTDNQYKLVLTFFFDGMFDVSGTQRFRPLVTGLIDANCFWQESVFFINKFHFRVGMSAFKVCPAIPLRLLHWIL